LFIPFPSPFFWKQVMLDKLVRSRKYTRIVMPAKAGIQEYQRVRKALDPGFRRGDDFFTNASCLANSQRVYQHL